MQTGTTRAREAGEDGSSPLTPAGRAGEAAEAPAAAAGRIAVAGGDDAVTRIQLAARWAEAYAPPAGDSLPAVLQRFKTAFEYLDAVTHGIEPHPFEDTPDHLGA